MPRSEHGTAARRARPRLTADAGVYLLVIDLDAPLALEIASLPAAVLPPGRYVYCGSAHGPGGIRARVGRHLRAGKAAHWHVDRLTAAGRIAGVRAWPGGRECDVFAGVLATPGARVPVRGFGASDCRRCPAHLAAVPPGFGAAALAPISASAAQGLGVAVDRKRLARNLRARIGAHEQHQFGDVVRADEGVQRALLQVALTDA